MNRMADTVIKDKDMADRQLMSKIKQYEEEKERRDKQDEDMR